MDAKYACKSPEHTIARRQFMGSLAAVGASACAGDRTLPSRVLVGVTRWATTAKVLISAMVSPAVRFGKGWRPFRPPIDAVL